MSSFVVYILHAPLYDKIYIGYTSNLIERIKAHNHFATKGYCRRFRPWMVLDVEFFSSKKEAMKREKQLKSASGRQYARSLIK